MKMKPHKTYFYQKEAPKQINLSISALEDPNKFQRKIVCGVYLTSSRTLMIEQDPIHSKEVIGFPEVYHYPVCIEFSSTCEKKWYIYLYAYIYKNKFVYLFKDTACF